tara:strand:+ start:26984 stop:28906 length:1923 start_codon:yes stop_codon:yes gene_type:complete
MSSNITFFILSKFKTLSDKTNVFSPVFRTIALIVIDIFFIFLSYLTILSICNEDLIFFNFIYLLTTSSFIAIPIYSFFGQYKGISRYAGSRNLYSLLCRNAFLIVLLNILSIYFRFYSIPLKVWLIFWIALSFLQGGFRLVFRDLYLFFRNFSSKEKTRVAIYGAGSAGAQLAATLRLGSKYNIITFLDDCPSLLNRKLNGIPIKNLDNIGNVLDRLDQILIAIPSASELTRKRIIDSLKQYELPVLEIPSIEEIASGNSKIDSLKAIDIEDLLFRDSALPNKDLLGPGITNGIICVTGAGGSIGSELCRQIIKLKPKRLIIFERNEPSLYLINQELIEICDEKSEVIPILGSAKNKSLVESIFKRYNVQIIFHAAAYKHVPLVEQNPLEGIANNVFSTMVLCECSLNSNVQKLILISTDKAVRPTNVMGASKRIAELIVQAYSQKALLNQAKYSKTKFSMVRFGNVLNSSGSVVPLFRKQIQRGGPITITHDKVIRYFMTIQEASQLVIQASVLAEGGDVFLLDMGKPLRIYDLAEKMVKLSGMKLKNKENPLGDIEIIYTGLRPGEKLFEELLIDANSQNTKHPKIFKAIENSFSFEFLIPKIYELKEYILKQDKKNTITIISKLLPEWQIYEGTKRG